MQLSCTSFCLPKRGNSSEEYEDAAWPSQACEKECDSFKCAVADGATESSFSDKWARLLVKGFADDTSLEELRAAWAEAIAGMELPWYAEQKADVGAFAAVLGLTLTDGEDRKWIARSIGDCCLFHVRDKKTILTFPVEDYKSFGSSPVLLGSRNPTEGEDPEYDTSGGDWQDGDLFVLLTDAIAAWVFEKFKEKQQRLDTLIALNSQEDFAELISKQRESTTEDGKPHLKNDDVTLLKIMING